MKTTTKTILWYTLFNVLLYFIISYIRWDINWIESIKSWGKIDRLFSIIFLVLYQGIVTIVGQVFIDIFD